MGGDPRGGQKFSHSNWQDELLTPQEILKRNPQQMRRLDRAGQASAIVFGYRNGKRTLRQIEEAVLRDHPALFPSTDGISRFVAQVLGKDSD